MNRMADFVSIRAPALAATPRSNPAGSASAKPSHTELRRLLRRAVAKVGTGLGLISVHRKGYAEPEVLATQGLSDLAVDQVITAVAEQIDDAINLTDEFNPLPSSLATFVGPIEGLPEPMACLSLICPVGMHQIVSLTLCGTGSSLVGNEGHMRGDVDDWIMMCLRLWAEAETERQHAQIFASALRRWKVATLLLEEDGRIIFANEAAQDLLTKRDGIRRSGQSITASDFEDAVRLKTVIQHGSARENNDGGDDPQTPLLLLNRKGARPLTVAVSALAAVNMFDTRAASVMIVLDPDMDFQPTIRSVCSLYRLTTTEASLVCHLVSGRTISEAAEQMRIRTQTARAYLKQIFAKTNTHRQADLIRLILNSFVPLA